MLLQLTERRAYFWVWRVSQRGRGGRRWRQGWGQRLRRPRAASGRLRCCLGGGGVTERQGQRLGRRGGAGGRREWLGRRCRATAAARHTRASGREDRMNRRGRRPSVKFVYFRWSPRRLSEISLCPTAGLPALGCPTLCTTAASSRRVYAYVRRFPRRPSDISEPSDLYCFYCSVER
jgi:hypothetical protein